MTEATQPDASRNPFSPDVVAAVCDHMNGDHPEDNVLIVRAQGRRPETTAARMTGLDGLGADFTATVGGAEEAVRVPWGHPLTERREVRIEVVRLYHEACAILGVTPRGEGEH